MGENSSGTDSDFLDILYMTGYAGSRDYVGNSVENPTLVASSVHSTPAQNSQRDGRSFHERVGVLFFNGMWESVWSSPRRLQVYVIPRPGVPHHICNEFLDIYPRISEIFTKYIHGHLKNFELVLVDV